LPTLRLGLSFASLWGVLSFSMCGLSFPAMAMHPVLQGLANLFPLRHYFLIYVDQALNGYPMIYSWINYVALLIFMMLPFFVVHRLKRMDNVFIFHGILLLKLPPYPYPSYCLSFSKIWSIAAVTFL
jgi:hypothetical protein